MNKFKKILLGALSVLTLGLVAVTGAKVEAATVTQECTFDGSISNNFFTGNSGSFKDKSYSGASILPSKTENVSYSKCYTTGCSFTVEYEWTGKIKFKNVNNGTKTITVKQGSETISSTSMASLEVKDLEINGTAGDVSISGGSNFALIEMYITYDNESGNKNFDSLAISNSKNYYVDDSFDLNNLVVSAIFDDDSNKTLSSSEYSYTISPSLVDGKFASATTYTITVTATIGEVEKSTSLDINVTNAIRHSVTFKQYSTDTDPYATVSNVIEGESIGETNWPLGPRVLNKSFVGWFNGDVEYTSTTQITEDTLLVAKYDELANDILKFEDYNAKLSDKSTVTSFTIYEGFIASDSVKKGSQAYSFANGDSLTGYIQSKNIEFALSKPAYITFYGTQTNNSNTRVTSLSKNDTKLKEFTFDKKTDGTKAVYTFYLNEGSYKLETPDGVVNYYGIRINQNLKGNSTASVFAEKNTAGDKLRFVGTITGITDLASVEKIELILGKNGTLAKNPINLTKCYTSVEGSSQTCAAADGTYYTIFRLSGIDKLAAGTKISKQLKVTFTDGSTTISDSSEITL